ncbi:MAG: branched-chain amino acid ABC transporter permease [Deltaproteobacteria bacterium]|nr:branched-chain amino acid ABC transporter permease [Deltaproteobacteria bacterium]MBW2009098.1 branched-chain amino acid ABC transporter permease [Deltaproteobacteria bacterium]MBW2349182.1 branched-chain amino acid ABC transporter permease [Deltaproteobacteria bacterium]
MRPCGIFDERYTQDMAILRTKQHWALLVGALILLYLFPLFGSYYLVSFLNNLFITIIVVLGLQIVSGYCGQISFGQPAFMAVGGYASAILTLKAGVSFWLALPLSGLIAGVFGIIGGAPSLRIKGFYLAIATIAIHFVTMWLILHLKITGATQGLNPMPPEIFGFPLDTDERMYYLIATVMLIMTFGARNLVRSKVGRAFVAIRDNDLAAEVMGMNLYHYKLLAFFISCFFAGIAGSLYGHLIMVVHPEQYTLTHALWYVGMIIIGGMGSIPGTFFGVIFVRVLDELVLFASPFLSEAFPWLGASPAAALGLSAFGLVLIVFLVFEPRGLAHRWEIFKASYRLYPFAY